MDAEKENEKTNAVYEEKSKEGLADLVTKILSIPIIQTFIGSYINNESQKFKR